jgi:hypothetical protein
MLRSTLAYLAELLVLATVIAVLTGLYHLAVFLFRARRRRPDEQGFMYVYVEQDGTARELDEEEIDYLNTEFEGGDSGRPYIKSYYNELTPDGKIHGYLQRNQLPKKVPIRS